MSAKLSPEQINIQRSRLSETLEQTLRFIAGGKSVTNPNSFVINLTNLGKLLDDSHYYGHFNDLVADYKNRFNKEIGYYKDLSGYKKRFNEIVDSYLSKSPSKITNDMDIDEDRKQAPYQQSSFQSHQYVQTDKQVMIHEAQMIDSYRRVMAAINSTIRVINNRGDATDQLNNLNIQIQVASGIFHDPKYKDKNKSRLMELEKKFKNEYIPDFGNKGLKTSIDIFKSSFREKIDPAELPVIGGGPMSQKDVSVALGSLNYAGHINDHVKVKARDARCAEDLTIFKEQYDPMNPTYVKNYGMVDHHANVFRGYSGH